MGHQPPGLSCLLGELGCAQGQLFPRLMAWVGVAEMAQVGAGGDAASVSPLPSVRVEGAG